jgi:cytochrome P450 family 6
MGIFLYLLLGALALCYWLVKKQFNYWEERGFLSPPSVFPFGSLKGVGTKVTTAEGVQEIYKKFKGKTPAAGIFFFLSPSLLPIDPELIKNILVRDFSSFHDRGFYYNKEDDPTSAK